MVLIVRDITNVTIEYLTHLENASSCRVLGPEVFWYFWNCVNSDAIEIVFDDNVFYPVFEVLADVSIALI